MPGVGFEPTIPASEDSSCLRPRGYCDRLSLLNANIIRDKQLSQARKAGFLLGLPFNSEDGGEMFLRNLGSPDRHEPESESCGNFWKILQTSWWSRNSAVGIATGYGLNDRRVGVRVPVGSKIFSSPHRPDRLWGSPNLLSNGYRGLFPRGYGDRSVKLTTHLQLVPRSRKYGSIHPLSHATSWCIAN
jgi:hypothetical protein